MRKIVSEFGTTLYLAIKSKQLKSENGIFGEVCKKKGKNLLEETMKKIQNFYEDNSRIQSSISASISVKINGNKQRVQKRLLQCSLSELHCIFKDSYPKMKVSFSKFANLRPKYCTLPGRYAQYMCLYYSPNVKIMVDAIDLEKLTEKGTKKLVDYKDCLAQINCDQPTEACFLNECDKCPNIEEFQEYLQQLLYDSLIYEVKYAVWTSTDRSTILTVQESVEDFVENFCDKLLKLNPHSFITKKQSQFINNRKMNLSSSEVMVDFDFSENFSCVVQDAAQAFHFNNDQCTVFPVFYYYRLDSKIIHKSCIFLSKSKEHGTAAVYTVLQQLIPDIKNNVPSVKKIIYRRSKPTFQK